MTTHSIGTGTIQGCGCEYCGAAGAQDGFIVIASYAEPEPLDLIWNRDPVKESDVEAALQSAQGAVGSTEAPPDLWAGISGPAESSDLRWNSILRGIHDEQETEAYQYLKRLFLHLAPQCCVLPDLLGVCTQLDNAIAGLTIENASLKAKLAAFTAFTAFTDDPPDLPDPPRRPDGTLMPQPKALTVPRETGDKRRIGG